MINWRIIPYVRIVILFAIGVFIADSMDQKISINVSFSITICVTLLLTLLRLISIEPITAHLKTWLLLFLFFSLGFIRYQSNQVDAPTDYFAKLYSTEKILQGVICEVPKIRTSAKTEINIINICNIDGICEPVSGKILAYFSKDDSLAVQYQPGDLISFQSKITLTKPSGNPKSFDFQSYLKYRKIIHQTYIAAPNHYLLEKDHQDFISIASFKVRSKLLSIYRNYLPNDDQFAIISAMILGYRNTIPDELYQAFSDSGAVHVLAVSGLHVGIVAAFFIFFINKISDKKSYLKWLKLVLLLFVIWSFAFITGSAPAIMRAAMMFSILWFGKYFFEYQNTYNILSFSALTMLIYDPYFLFQASFQFSYTAMLSLLFFQPYVSKWIIFKNRYLRHLWSMISAAISAQVLVFPITIFFFHKFPIYFILSGVICVFLGIVTLYLGLLLALFEFLFPWANLILGKLFSFSSSIFISSVKWVKSLPYSSIDGLWMSIGEFLFIYLFLIAFMFFLVYRKKQAVTYMAIMCIGIIISNYQKNKDRKFYLGMTFYDSFNNTTIDFFDNETVYSYSDTILSLKDNKFICDNNRYFHGMKNLVLISNQEEIEGLRFYKHNSMIQLENHRIVILDESTVESDLIKSAEIIIVLKSSKWSTNALEEGLFENKLIIFEKGLKNYYKKKMIERCVSSNGCQIHDIGESGAYDKNFGKQ